LQHITLIVAADLNHAIGKGGKLPWHLPQDLRFFKNTTWAMPVIMGRKTFDSMGKPLPGRTNIVITRNVDWNHVGVLKSDGIESAITIAQSLHVNEIFIIGGGTIYEAALPFANRVYVTRVKTSLNDADTWFPELSPEDWQLIWERPFSADEKHAFDYSFQCWERVGEGG
jgi:dihydrofolate reductase